MDPRTGVDLDLVENDEIGMTPLLSEEVSYILSTVM